MVSKGSPRRRERAFIAGSSALRSSEKTPATGEMLVQCYRDAKIPEGVIRLLVGGRRDRVERHRTVRATLDWSYDLLSPAEQAVFRRLSTFTGPFDLDAAERVAAGDDLDAVDVDDLVGCLVDRSLLTVETGRTTERRYRMLETIRQYAAETLTQSGDLAAADSTHTHAAESPTLTQTHILAPADSAHGHASDSPTLTTGTTLQPADSVHGHTVDQPAVTQVHELAPADSTHAHTTEAP